MKLSRSNVRTLAAALVFACLLAWATPAFAGSLEDTPTAESSTNPNPPNETDAGAWREGWGNTLRPDLHFTGIPGDDGIPTLGFYYRLARTPMAPMDSYASSTNITYDAEGAMIAHSFDMMGIYNQLPDGERTALESPWRINDPREGEWWVTVRFFNRSHEATVAWSYRLSIDLTPPRPVTGFTTGVSSPTETTRRTLTWFNTDYDDLSGSHWVEIFLNGKHVRTASLPWYIAGKVTLEDLPPGVNKIGVRTIDRATNRSSFVYHTDIVDPDVPSLAITYPAASAWLNGTRTFSVNSTDLAGNPVVTFKIDGVVKGTDSAPPYQLKVDTTRLGAGGHTFTVVTKDLYGHTRSAVQAFNVDNTAIRLSSMSVTPNPFYPVLHDGYKDTAAMRVYLGEAATEAYLEIYDAGGAMVRKYKKTNVGAGTLSMSWDGKNSDGVVSTGNFWFRFVVKDRAGNWTKTGMSSIIIRDYELVRVGPDTVRIVPR